MTAESTTNVPTPTIREQEESLDAGVERAGKASRGGRKRLHMTLQAKGGIGKSHVARLLGEYFTEATAYDLDEQNQTLASIQVLDAKVVRVLKDGRPGEIDVEAYDELFGLILADTARDVVVDVGSWLYGETLSFLDESGVPELLESAKRDLWLHLIACGGAMQNETMSDIDRIIERWGSVANILLWDNEYHGFVRGGKNKELRGLANTDTFMNKWRTRVKGIIKLERPSAMYAADVASVLAAGATFQQVAEMPETPVTKRSRIVRAFTAVANDLNVVFQPSAVRGKPIPERTVQQLSEERMRIADDIHPDDPDAIHAPADPERDDALGQTPAEDTPKEGEHMSQVIDDSVGIDPEDAIDAALESDFIGDDIDPEDDFWERSGSDLMNPDADAPGE